MSIVVIGINHRTGPLEVLEKATIAEDALPKALHGIASRNDVREVIVLSTCNRTEVYADVERFHSAYEDICDFFCEKSGLSAEIVQPHLYSQYDAAAVEHLFNVAAGLDSAIVGESEILGQVKNAWEKAHSEGTSRSSLNLLFRHAVETGKRARTETSINRGTASVSFAAVEMAQEIVGSLAGKEVLVVGAGDMGEGVASALARAGACITVMNRTESRAKDLADRMGAKVESLDDLESALATADVCVSCTGAGEPLITRDMLQRARQSATNPLLIVDIALPRDVEASVVEVVGVSLRDMHDLADWAQRGIESRAGEAQKVHGIVSEEVERYLVEVTSRQVAPLLAQLREIAEEIRTSELDRFGKRLADLTVEQRDVVENITRGIVAKLLHTPSIQLKDAAGSAHGERLATALRDLFNLH